MKAWNTLEGGVEYSHYEGMEHSGRWGGAYSHYEGMEHSGRWGRIFPAWNTLKGGVDRVSYRIFRKGGETI